MPPSSTPLGGAAGQSTGDCCIVVDYLDQYSTAVFFFPVVMLCLCLPHAPPVMCSSGKVMSQLEVKTRPE